MDNLITFPNKNHKMLEFKTNDGAVYYVDFNNKQAVSKFFSMGLSIKSTHAYKFDKNYINFNEEGVVEK